MEEKLKLAENVRVDVLSSLKIRETKLLNSIKEHNESKGFLKKEVYTVQGFEIKALNLGHAHKKIKKLLMNSGFHPEATRENFKEWYDKLTIIEEE